MIALRRLQIDDLDTVHALISNKEVVRFTLFAVCSREESEKFLTESINESPSAAWRSVVRAIISEPDGELVGLCGIVNLRGNSDGEIWYLINPELWGKGIATKAVTTARAWILGDEPAPNLGDVFSGEPSLRTRAGKSRYAQGRVFGQEPQDSWRMEEQLSLRDPSRRVVRVCAASGSQLLKSGDFTVLIARCYTKWRCKSPMSREPISNRHALSVQRSRGNRYVGLLSNALPKTRLSASRISQAMIDVGVRSVPCAVRFPG